MAMHRKPTTDNSPPPAELLRFRPDNWTGQSTASETTWYPAYERWCAARQAWDSEHPGWLGDAAEQLRDEYETRHEHMQRWPLEPMGPVKIITTSFKKASTTR
jgi:hypothetical protein